MNKEKGTVFFGAGSIAEKTILKGYSKPKYIFDNNLDLANTTQHGVRILPGNQIKDRLSEFEKIIITTSSFTEVKRQLLDLGISDEKIEISSILDTLRFVEKLENFCGKILFTSGLPSFTESNEGGGLYLLTVDKKRYDLKKIHSGNCHGTFFDSVKKEYYVTDNDLGIVVFNEELKKTKLIELEKGLRPHGISNINDDTLAIGCTFDDSVILINKNNGNTISRLGLSTKKYELNSPQHHLNDIWVEKGEIFASMFSLSGNWKQGKFDGSVVSFGNKIFENSTGKYDKILTNLKMPHNFQIKYNETLICNSLEAQLINSNKKVMYQSNGFVRGLFFNKKNLIIGESRNRNFANIKSSILNSSIDTRISIVDRESKAFRSIQFPLEISEIHSILLIE